MCTELRTLTLMSFEESVTDGSSRKQVFLFLAAVQRPGMRNRPVGKRITHDIVALFLLHGNGVKRKANGD